MNKHIVLVMKWLNDNDSVTKQELADSSADQLPTPLSVFRKEITCLNP